MIFPIRLNAGFDNTWDIEAEDYLAADGWTLKYVLRPVGVEAIEITAVTIPGETAFRFVFSKSSGVALSGGMAVWQCSAERLSERILFATGRVEVISDLNNKAADPRPYAERMIAGIDAALEDRIDDPACEQEYNGRKIKYMAMSELLRLRGYFLEMLPDNNETHELIRFTHVG